MALGARLDDVGTAQGRFGIGDAAGFVSAVAIVTLGGLEISETRDFPVIRLEVPLGDLLVAIAALVHDVESEIGDVSALDAVR